MDYLLLKANTHSSRSCFFQMEKVLEASAEEQQCRHVSSSPLLIVWELLQKFASWYGGIAKDALPFHRIGLSYAKHPLFEKTGSKHREHDIAVILMNKPAEVVPANLPTKRSAANDFNGKSMTTLGWGVTESGNDLSRYLRYSIIIGETLTNCGNYLNSNYICGKGTNKSQIRPGDSGGPLLSGNTLIGVNSVYVGDKSIFVRVDQYLDWISKPDLKCI